MPVNTFSSGAVVTAAAHNQNWALAVLTDTARTITVTHSWTASQTFTGGFTTGASATLGGHLLFTDNTYDIGASGATRPRTAYFGTAIVIGTTPATTGAIRLPNNTEIKARNAANSADINVAYLDTSNVLQLGGSSGVTVTGAFTGTSGNFTLDIRNTRANGTSSDIQLIQTGVATWNIRNEGTTGDYVLRNDAVGNQFRLTSAGVGTFLSGMAATYGAFGTTPATTGAVRVPNNTAISGRNAANNADYIIAFVRTDETIAFDGSNRGAIFGAGITVGTTLTTAAPSGSSAGAWKLGAANSVSPTSPNRTIAIDIGGTVYYLHAKTTND
jgi:hypothetical protein